MASPIDGVNYSFLQGGVVDQIFGEIDPDYYVYPDDRGRA
jgi:hypothetical protein